MNAKQLKVANEMFTELVIGRRLYRRRHAANIKELTTLKTPHDKLIKRAVKVGIGKTAT